MLLELYVFYEIIMLAFFSTAFFTKHEILWALSAVLSGVLMFSSFDIQISTYEFNNTISAYSPVIVTQSYSYLVWINGLFFLLGMVLGIFDLFDKYGGKFLGKEKEE
jgi:hypothetical protein